MTHGRKETRLSSLQPGSRGDPIDRDLSVTRLGELPTYEALSYTWCAPAVTVSILLRGALFNVTTDLYGALCHLRNESLPRTL